MLKRKPVETESKVLKRLKPNPSLNFIHPTTDAKNVTTSKLKRPKVENTTSYPPCKRLRTLSLVQRCGEPPNYQSEKKSQLLSPPHVQGVPVSQAKEAKRKQTQRATYRRASALKAGHLGSLKGKTRNKHGMTYLQTRTVREPARKKYLRHH